jgi:enediyne biosynthesis protein E4
MKFALTLSIACLFLMSCSTHEQPLFKLLNPDQTQILFNNVITETDDFNILTEEYIFNGGGVAVGDFNNDGLPDLFFSGNQVNNALYINKGNLKFEDISRNAGIEAFDRWNTGVTVVDINGDGFLDIYVCSAMYPDPAKRKNLLFVNQGLDASGLPTFKEQAESYGIAEAGNSMSATFFDYNNDGLLDLYVLNNELTAAIPSNYRPKITDGSATNNDQLYKNNGDGTFSNVTLEAGITYEGFGLGLAIADVNKDGWPDIYISNDYVANDVLYINNRNGTFSNHSAQWIKHTSMFSMGSDFSDFNNDGYVDLVTLDMLGESNYRKKTTISKNSYQTYLSNEEYGFDYQYIRNMLHLGNGTGVPFSEIGMLAGVYQTDWSWSPLFVDMDNDGYRDLLITNGFPRDITDKDFMNYRADVGAFATPKQLLDSIPIVKIPNYAFKNSKDLTFENVGAQWGLGQESFSNGAVFVDLDLDGDLDYVVNNINDPAFVFENTLNHRQEKPNFLRVDLKGTPLNPKGIGCKVTLTMEDGSIQYHEQFLTRGYMSSVENIIHFGLGAQQKIDKIEVYWPNGNYQNISNPEINKVLVVAIQNAQKIAFEDLPFPFQERKIAPLVEDVSSQFGVNYFHNEYDVSDYYIQRTLPHKFSQSGPSLAVGDINGDGLEDFIVGSSSRFSPILFFQNENGQFTSKELFSEEEDKLREESGIALFDLDNDGDLDLFLVSGSNEFPVGAEQYRDQLYINDGKGNFLKSHAFGSNILESGSVVKAADFDGDGFVDLFVGSRVAVGSYPMSGKSQLLKNEKGQLKAVGNDVFPDLDQLGMVTDALWTDFNADGKLDLMVVGELMAPKFYLFDGKKFVQLKNSGLDPYVGWWNSVVAADFDQDGDMDYMLGNLGANNHYHVTKDRPVKILAKDFDGNGSIDPVIFQYLKDQSGDYQLVPAHYWDDLFGQSTLFRRKFTGYKSFSSATYDNLLSVEERKGAKEFVVNYTHSAWIENLGNGSFKVHALPQWVQMAPIQGMLVDDINKDGNPDVFMIGNDYGNEIFIGRHDAFNGLVLLGNGDGTFKVQHPRESGFLVSGDAKSMALLHNKKGQALYLATQNRGQLKLYQNLYK